VKKYKLILIVFLIGVIIFAIFQYILSLKEQVLVLENEEQALLQTLENERQLKQKLVEENAQLQENLKPSEENLVALDTDLNEAKNKIEELGSHIHLLKAENIALREKNASLASGLDSVVKEKDNLQAKLSSIVELKKAIKELRRQAYKVGQEIKEEIQNDIIMEGNRGFLLKEGKSTYSAKVKIEVKPLPSDK
jgi:chromosome segregation ATPase